MSGYKTQLGNIETKVDMLLEYCDALKEQNQILLSENESQKKKSEQLYTQLKELEEKHRILKLARSVAETSEKSLDIKAKINDFVREIDKCIAILTK
jgi:cell division septum initiation protein DivIVA